MRVRASLVVWVVLITSLVVGQTAARAEDAEKARQLFSQGSKFYDVGQFDKAIEAWQQGYDQKPDPSFLFNIAQAYRQKDDPKQAIFFYKSYLRNSPKAANRADVEQRIAALQKQIDTGVKAPPTPGPTGPAVTATPPPPTTPPPPPPPGPTATEPPPPPPSTSPPPATYAEGPPVVSAVVTPEGMIPQRHYDLAAGVGTAFWSSGLQGTADPSFAFTLGAGYTFGQAAAHVRFRMGVLFGYTFLSEAASTESFLSFLLDPTLDVRLSASQKWVLSFDIGIGAMAITGLKKTSALLDQGQTLMINGAQSMALTRFGVALQYRLSDVSFFIWPAIATSPKKDHFHAAITRVETLIGAAYRF